MNYHRKIFFLAISLFLLIEREGHSQDRTMDSLKAVVKNSGIDTLKCAALNAMIEAENDESIWSKYNEELLKIAQNKLKRLKKEDAEYITMKKYQAVAINNTGYLFSTRGEKTKAIECYESSLKIQEEIGDKLGVANSLNNIGSIYKVIGERAMTNNEATANAIASLHPLQRLGEADDIATMAALLLSPTSGWITGQVIGIDGGRSTLRTKG